MSSKVCSKCGARIPGDSVFCEECGAKLSAETESDTKRLVFKKAVYESQVEVGPSVSTTTTAKAPRTASKTRLLTSVVLLVIAVVSTAYLMYPSMPHTVSEVYIGSSTSTSTYLSYSTHLTGTIVSATTTRENCRKGDCTTRTLTVSSYSSFYTAEQVLSTQYSHTITHSYTTSRSEIIPPHSYLGLSDSAFAIVTIAEFGVLVGVLIFLFLRKPSVAKRIGPMEVEPPKVKPVEPAAVPKDKETIKPPNLVPVLTLTLITLNVLFFIAEERRGGSENMSVLIEMGAVTSSVLTYGEYPRILLAPFLHVGAGHLISNMYALLFIGWALERVYGHLRFAAAYFLSGTVGSLLSAMTIPIGVVGAGASGAILGCLVALVVLQSRFSHVSFGLRLGSAVLSLVYNLLAGLLPGSGIDNAAHFGGAIGGLLLALTVPPPEEFFSHVALQMKPDYVLEQKASTEQAGRTGGQKTGYQKIILASVLVVLLLAGAFALASYPRLLVSDARISSSYYLFSGSTVAGYVKIQIGGSGAFELQSVTVTLDNAPLSVRYTERAFLLPQQLSLNVAGPASSTLPPVSSILVVTVDGTWGALGSTPTIPVHITAQETIEWTYS